MRSKGCTVGSALPVLMTASRLRSCVKPGLEALGLVGAPVLWGGGKSGVPTTFRAEQGHAGDGCQRSLRSRSLPRLTPGVGPHPHSERLIRYRRWWDVESTYIPEDGARLFQNLQQPWWVAGGWAIDMFLGKHTRPHVHLDIATLRRDQLAIQQYLCSRGWDLHMVMEPGVMRPWPEGELLDPSRHAVWCRPSLDFHDGEMP